MGVGPDMRFSTGKILALAAILYVAGFLAHAAYLHKTVYGDGIYYYSWLRSVVVDHNVNFTNEYAYFHAAQPLIRPGLPGNKYTIGPALLWLPTFLWIQSFAKGSGYELPYQLAVGLTSVLYCLFGMALLFRLLNDKYSNTISALTTISILFATNLLFYGSLDTVSSHAVSFFAAAIFLTFVFESKKRWLLIGAALGLIGLIRTQDLMYGLLLIPYFKPKSLPMLAIGLFLAFSPQLLAWQLLYGRFWISPYLTKSEGFTFMHPQILGVLFSIQNGLFLWTPITLIAIVGLILPGKHRALYKLMVGIILLQIYLVASWSTWWQGASYSGRMFVSMLPLFAFGLANFFQYLQKYRFRALQLILSFVGPLSVINALLIIYFLLKK